MKNEVFKKAAEAVEAFQKDYQERLGAAEKQLEQLEAKQAQAAIKAEEAVAANDQAAWRKADKDRMDAEAGIKFTQERLAMIQRGEAYPLRDYDALLDQIDVEQSRATLAFVRELQDLYQQTRAAYDRLQEVLGEGQEALGILYAAGEGTDAGYRRLAESRANWGYLLNTGELLKKGALDFDIETGEGLNFNNAVHRAVAAAKEAIQREEGKK